MYKRQFQDTTRVLTEASTLGKTDTLEGFKEVVCRIAGEEVFRFLKYEGGVHRVQRVQSRPPVSKSSTTAV